MVLPWEHCPTGGVFLVAKLKLETGSFVVVVVVVVVVDVVVVVVVVVVTTAVCVSVV